MREIKFRAWHQKSGVMLLWEHVEELMTGQKMHIAQREKINRYDPRGSNEECAIYEIWPHHLFSTELEVLQYTGLKDKNGKEIYEGDIVLEVIVGEVKYYRCGFMCFSKLGSAWHPNEACEVIGNIYENPELLK